MFVALLIISLLVVAATGQGIENLEVSERFVVKIALFTGHFTALQWWRQRMCAVLSLPKRNDLS